MANKDMFMIVNKQIQWIKINSMNQPSTWLGVDVVEDSLEEPLA